MEVSVLVIMVVVTQVLVVAVQAVLVEIHPLLAEELVEQVEQVFYPQSAAVQSIMLPEVPDLRVLAVLKGLLRLAVQQQDKMVQQILEMVQVVATLLHGLA